MLMLLRRLSFLICTILMLVTGLTRQSSYAQTGASTCSSLVQQAIAALGTNCEGLGRNSACYGTFRVNATFTDPEVQASFTTPADQAPIDTLETIHTAPLNTETNEWGVAVISAQANLPGVLPGQNLLFLLIGDTEVENAVPQNEAFQSGDPLRVLVPIESNLREYPGINAAVAGVIPAGTELLTDAVSEDGEWLRTAYHDLAGWVSRDAVSSEEDLSSLPAYTSMSFTPMQAFYLRTNIGGDCSEAPSALVVQGPEHLTIDINANGADIRLGSTVLFRTLPLDGYAGDLPDDAGSLFQIIVLDGTAILNPDSDNPIIVPVGYTTVACLSNPQNLGTDGETNDTIVLADCGFTPPRPLTEDEWAEFTTLNGLSLNYPIDLDEFLETCEPNSDWVNTYVVQPGDALSRIAEMFDTSAEVLAAGNCIENPDILSVGQVLRVPATEPPTEPSTPTQEPTQPQQEQPPAPTSVPPTSEPGTPVVTPPVEETPPAEQTPEETPLPE